MTVESRDPWPLPAATWPSAAAAGESRLFSPVRLGPLWARTRTWVPAMVPWRATEQGVVTPEILAWYGRFAQGRPGVIVVEATGIRDVKSGPLLRIGHDRFIPGLQRLVETVRENSGGTTRLLIQIIDFLTVRRRPKPETFFERYLDVGERHRDALASVLSDRAWRTADDAAVRGRLAELEPDVLDDVLDERELESLRMGFRERVTDTHVPWIANLPRRLPALFTNAAERARRAGFDGVELHFAHAYTMASFLSRRNTRSDGYGGSLEGRVRLPRDVIAAVRRRVGSDYCVGARFLGDEVIEGGSRIEDACWFATRFAEVGLDFLSVSKGGKFEDARVPKVGDAVYPYTGRSGHECMPTVRIDHPGPFGRNVPLAAAVRRAVRSAGYHQPVVASGGLCTFDQMEAILRRGDADVCGAARQSLADPDWWRKVELGAGDAVRRCIYTNYCEGLDQRHKEVTCQLWDKADDAGEDGARARDGRRRLLAPDWSPDVTTT
ncbi:MAG: NADH oxidase [Deltaproteobacteria bacterium]|nr:NADH oxidase [Deltaproteobacteria bacterium]